MKRLLVVDRFSGTKYGFSKQFDGENIKFCSTAIRLEDLSGVGVVHFDWADYLLVDSIEHIPSSIRVTVRLHAYELFESSWMNQIRWDKIDVLIFVSGYYCSLFKKLYPSASPKSMAVVHHGVDLDRFKLVEKRGDDILYVGSVNFKKGPQLLAQVAMQYPDREVHVFGDIQCARSREYFEYLSLKNLKFFPHRADIERVMQDPRYGYILSTSLGESFHLAVAEGMACGLNPLVHNWPGAKNLWPSVWNTLSDVDLLMQNTKSPVECRSFVESTYSSRVRGQQLINVVLGNFRRGQHMQSTIALCMITKDCFAGVERALRSCAPVVKHAYIAVDSRDTDNTLERAMALMDDLRMSGLIKMFVAPEPWDFSAARNIAHGMNTCDWALVLDDDEFVQHPEEILQMIQQHGDADVIEVMTGTGIDKYGNVAHTWRSPRIMKKHVLWKNARHNIPDPKYIQKQVPWPGKFMVIDDKSIRPNDIRQARNEQRHSNIDEFRRKVDESPTDTRSQFYLATAYKEKGLLWEAIHWYEHYLKAGGWDEERWQACFELAICHLSLKRYTDARDAVYRSLRERWDRAESFVLMGDIWYRCGRFEDAVAWYTLGCALPYPANARLFVRKSMYDWERWDKLSMAYFHLGRYTEAIECARKVLEVRPGDERVLNNVKCWESK